MPAPATGCCPARPSIGSSSRRSPSSSSPIRSPRGPTSPPAPRSRCSASRACWPRRSSAFTWETRSPRSSSSPNDVPTLAVEKKEHAMDFAKVNAEVRRDTGKGNARRTRAAGKVPAVLYGRDEQPLSLSLDPLGLVRSMDKERRRNTVFSLAVADGGASTDVTVMIRDVQIDPLKRTIVHVDFLRVDLNDEVRVTVPLALKGIPVGVTNGGNLHQ